MHHQRLWRGLSLQPGLQRKPLPGTVPNPQASDHGSVVVDRRRFDADPAPTFLDADLDPDSDPNPKVKHAGKSKFFMFSDPPK